jgi:hypothetical protein
MTTDDKERSVQEIINDRFADELTKHGKLVEEYEDQPQQEPGDDNPDHRGYTLKELVRREMINFENNDTWSDVYPHDEGVGERPMIPRAENDVPGSRIAKMRLSGTDVQVGYLTEDNPRNNSVWFHTDEQAEPVYISPTEARLLISVLQTAIEEAEETRA